MKLLRVVVLAGLLVVAAACGSDDSSEEANGASDTALTTSTTAAVVTTTSTSVVDTPPPSSCANIAFQANSDNAAADIKVKGVTCETADPVIRESNVAGYTYEKNSFTCVGKAVDDPMAMAYTDWTCTGVAGFDNQHIQFKNY